MNLFKALLLVLSFATSQLAEAKLIQIIHTNDLHSFFEGTRTGLGGYSRLKTVIQKLKDEASSKGIPTLVLDGGDFGEGSSYFLADEGVSSLKALDMLGIDVTVIGNHDYMLGGKELANQIKKSGLKAKILSANMKRKEAMGLSELVPDYVDYDLEGLKIRIMGLSTDEIHFRYPLKPDGSIGKSHKAGIHHAQKAQRDNVDFLIALTHTGLKKDTVLVQHSRSIGLVVGGHSHTRLEQPKMAENLNGELVPILQTGAHGLAVGSLLIDLQGNRKHTVIDYRLYDINPEVEQDSVMESFVLEAYANRERYFSRDWQEIIGFTEIPMNGYVNGRNRTGFFCWSRHMARMTREAAGTDIGMQFDQFQGEEIAPGPVQFGDMIDNYPHFRTWGDKGWVIAKAEMKGFILKQILKFFAKGEDPIIISVDGLQVKDQNSLILKPYNIMENTIDEALIHGEPIKNKKRYTVALPSEIPFGVYRTSKLVNKILFKELVNTDLHYWTVIEDYLKRNSPIRCLEEN